MFWYYSTISQPSVIVLISHTYMHSGCLLYCCTDCTVRNVFGMAYARNPSFCVLVGVVSDSDTTFFLMKELKTFVEVIMHWLDCSVL